MKIQKENFKMFVLFLLWFSAESFEFPLLYFNTDFFIFYRYVTYESDDWHNVTIKKPGLSDNGDYICGAKNEAGVAEQRVHVVSPKTDESFIFRPATSDNFILLLCIIIGECRICRIFLKLQQMYNINRNFPEFSKTPSKSLILRICDRLKNFGTFLATPVFGKILENVSKNIGGFHFPPTAFPNSTVVALSHHTCVLQPPHPRWYGLLCTPLSVGSTYSRSVVHPGR